eukprot:EC684056.1.p2 GENE.EC684056.1~~EC684056.1.p2  ORF type:complete len:90 (+),score=15.84 EC684056.1:35-304(+)
MEASVGLGWVAITPAPAPLVAEMGEAGIFYGNRVLNAFRDKPDGKAHVEFVNTFRPLYPVLSAYVTGVPHDGTHVERQGRGRREILARK